MNGTPMPPSSSDDYLRSIDRPPPSIPVSKSFSVKDHNDLMAKNAIFIITTFGESLKSRCSGAAKDMKDKFDQSFSPGLEDIITKIKLKAKEETQQGKQLTSNYIDTCLNFAYNQGVKLGYDKDLAKKAYDDAKNLEHYKDTIEELKPSFAFFSKSDKMRLSQAFVKIKEDFKSAIENGTKDYSKDLLSKIKWEEYLNTTSMDANQKKQFIENFEAVGKRWIHEIQLEKQVEMLKIKPPLKADQKKEVIEILEDASKKIASLRKQGKGIEIGLEIDNVVHDATTKIMHIFKPNVDPNKDYWEIQKFRTKLENAILD